MRQIVLDTETTGLEVEHGHRIIEIGCIEIINRKITGKHFHRYLNPQREIDEGALAVHGITSQFLQDKPLFSAVVHEFVDFIQGAELIIHNAPFDIGFLNRELQLVNFSSSLISNFCRVIDTLAMARQLHVGQRNSLDALCRRYSIDNTQRELHGALLDADLLARVYLAMTGGQSSLFEETDKQNTQNVQQATIVTKGYHDLLILSANENELLEHQKHLEFMQKQGECLWLAAGIAEECS